MRSFGLILLSVFLSTSCATLLNGERQQVFFKGGPEKGVTKVRTPDGTFELENGAGAYMLTRSKSNIPMKIECPDGKVKNGIIDTEFDWLKGGFGNILNGGWGWLIDPFMRESYNIKNPSLMDYCKPSRTAKDNS